MMRNVFVVVLLTGRIGIALVASSASSHARPPAGAKTTASVHDGEVLFNQKCLQCHSINEGQVGFGPSLYGELKKPYPKKTPAEIRAILKNGKGRMPSFDDKLTKEDVDNLFAYLHTL